MESRPLLNFQIQIMKYGSGGTLSGSRGVPSSGTACSTAWFSMVWASCTGMLWAFLKQQHIHILNLLNLWG